MKKISNFVKQIPFEYKFLVVFCSFFFLISFLLTSSAIMGDFRTFVFGIKHQFMWDPGGPYISSGVYFFRTDTVQFPGHPGLTLQILIGTISEFFYICARLGGCVANYPEFIIKNYPVLYKAPVHA